MQTMRLLLARLMYFKGYIETLWGKEGQIARNRCLCPAVRRPC